MRKRLHPHLTKNTCGPHSNDFGNNYFHGGKFNFFGISMDISWDQREGTWNISNTDEVADQEMVAALGDFANAMSQDNIDLVFGDEKEVSFNDLRTDRSYGTKDKFFYDKTGKRWMIGRSTAASPAESSLCIELRALGIDPTGVVKEFDALELIYIYPTEIMSGGK
jgi:hypothetical protein